MEKMEDIGNSCTHIHVTQEALETLFGGRSRAIVKKKDLSQPGQFACEERVTITGPKRSR